MEIAFFLLYKFIKDFYLVNLLNEIMKIIEFTPLVFHALPFCWRANFLKS